MLTLKNLPNFLTLSRVFLAAVFMVLLFSGGLTGKIAAFIVFLIASLTDYYDGKFARMSGVSSRFGRLMDPIADKILTLAAFLSFAELRLVSMWMVAVIVARDLIVTGVRFRMRMGSSDQAPEPSGKRKTAFQMIYIVSVLFFLILREMSFWKIGWSLVAERIIYGGMFLILLYTLWSGIQYLKVHLNFLARK